MTLGHNKVLVKREQAPEKTVGGFVIPDAAREKPDFGVVIEVGRSVLDWKKDDKVLFPKWCGFQVRVPTDEDGDYLVIFDDEVWVAL